MAGRGYYHWFSEINLPEGISEDECQSLYPKLLKNDQEAKHRIILGHIRLGMSIVARFARQYPHKTDSMVAEICDALVMGVEKIVEGAIEHHASPNITGFLVSCMVGRLKRWVTQDGIIRCSIATYRKLVAQGAEAPVHVMGLSPKHLEIESRFTFEDVDEMVNAITLTDRERMVIELRMEGMSDAEIAKRPEFNCTYQNIQHLRKKIGTRFLEKFCNGRE